ncbi:MAG: hypothetical protein JXR96_29370 [Deltaproteobacteria bacterium]|nr:hypothetical protein [Deltaproteobacteria bacterium]
MSARAIVRPGSYTVEHLADALDPPRFQHSSTRLQSGWVLLSGGLPDSEPDTTGVMQSQLFAHRPARDP